MKFTQIFDDAIKECVHFFSFQFDYCLKLVCFYTSGVFCWIQTTMKSSFTINNYSCSLISWAKLPQTFNGEVETNAIVSNEYDEAFYDFIFKTLICIIQMETTRNQHSLCANVSNKCGFPLERSKLIIFTSSIKNQKNTLRTFPIKPFSYNLKSKQTEKCSYFNFNSATFHIIKIYRLTCFSFLRKSIHWN